MAECQERCVDDPLHVAIDCRQVDWQVPTVVQIVDAL